MNHEIERQYFLERTAEFVRAMEEHSSEVHITDDHRVLFRAAGRPFEALAWIDEDYDLITVTTRTREASASQFNDAVRILQSTLQICWDHCVAVSPGENHFHLSMAIFIGGFSFEAFEGVVYNLLSCAESIEDIGKPPKKKKPSGSGGT